MCSFQHKWASERQYKEHYDERARPRFPREESGRQRKLSRLWHGPYRIVEVNDPDGSVVPVYFPEKGSIQIHQTRVNPCTGKLPAGFYWYGGNI